MAEDGRRYIPILIKKAQQSICIFKVSAIAFNNKGELLGKSCCTPRFYRRGGGVHAEMKLMKQYGNNIKTIIICRVGKDGGLLPIDPCPTCARKATELGIKIITVFGGNDVIS